MATLTNILEKIKEIALAENLFKAVYQEVVDPKRAYDTQLPALFVKSASKENRGQERKYLLKEGKIDFLLMVADKSNPFNTLDDLENKFETALLENKELIALCVNKGVEVSGSNLTNDVGMLRKSGGASSVLKIGFTYLKERG